MNNLAEIKSGDKLNMSLVVIEAQERETRASKPFLSVVLSDGERKINGNYWNWLPEMGAPAQNDILVVDAVVQEWQGTLQLNISSMKPDTSANLYDFMPNSGKDIEDVYKQAREFANTIPDAQLRKLADYILCNLRDKWMTIPGAKTVHHAYVGGTLIHSLSTAKLALAIAKQIPEANISLVMTGALLHDTGKLYTYGMDGVVIDYTDEGQLYEHSFIGAEFVGNFAETFDLEVDEAKLALLRHIILSHHRNLEFGAVITPKCIEAYIVNCADTIDAIAEQLREASKNSPNKTWLDKIWSLDNMRHLNPSYINNKVFAEMPQEN